MVHKDIASERRQVLQDALGREAAAAIDNCHSQGNIELFDAAYLARTREQWLEIKKAGFAPIPKAFK